VVTHSAEEKPPDIIEERTFKLFGTDRVLVISLLIGEEYSSLIQQDPLRK